MDLITTTEELDSFCSRQESAEYVTVDTEFMREKTYWPILCLVQVGGPDEAAAIDVLADGIDLEPLFKLMSDERILKVFHAARQDLEIFYHLMGHLPKPLFDTQVASMVLGFGEQVGYETLVSKLTDASVDKSSRFTDWSLRPLSERQITYALSDVTHLRPIYEKIARKLDANGRAAWLEQEMTVLTSPSTYDMPPELSFRRIKSRGAKPRFLAVLREVAAWREKQSQKRDLPRNRIIRDDALLEIAHHTPKSVQDLSRTRGLSRGMAEGEAGKALLKAVEAGLKVKDADCPEPVKKPDVPRGLGAVTDILKVLLKLKCEEGDVAQKLVASSSEIEQIAAYGDKAEVRALSGWRLEVFGNDALKLLKGDLALALEGRTLALVELDYTED